MAKEELVENIVTPRVNDVLMGRGNFCNKFTGNERFRALVRKHRVAYVACPKPLKGKFSRMIVDEVRGLNPPGRFLEQDSKTKLWRSIGKRRELRKTRQALREGAPEIVRAFTGIPVAASGGGGVGDCSQENAEHQSSAWEDRSAEKGSCGATSRLPEIVQSGTSNKGSVQQPESTRNTALTVVQCALTPGELMQQVTMKVATGDGKAGGGPASAVNFFNSCTVNRSLIQQGSTKATTGDEKDQNSIARLPHGVQELMQSHLTNVPPGGINGGKSAPATVQGTLNGNLMQQVMEAARGNEIGEMKSTPMNHFVQGALNQGLMQQQLMKKAEMGVGNGGNTAPNLVQGALNGALIQQQQNSHDAMAAAIRVGNGGNFDFLQGSMNGLTHQQIMEAMLEGELRGHHFMNATRGDGNVMNTNPTAAGQPPLNIGLMQQQGLSAALGDRNNGMTTLPSANFVQPGAIHGCRLMQQQLATAAMRGGNASGMNPLAMQQLQHLALHQQSLALGELQRRNLNSTLALKTLW